MLTIMVPAGNPAHVTGLADLGRKDIRLAMPNPAFEGIARQIEASLRKAGGPALADAVYKAKVADGTTVLTHIHHRQTPLFLMQGLADAGVTWKSEAIFQEQVGHPITHVDIPAGQNSTAIYGGAVVKDAPHADAARLWLAFIQSRTRARDLRGLRLQALPDARQRRRIPQAGGEVMSTTARSAYTSVTAPRERGIFPATLGDGARTWHIAGLALLSVRFIQGFIYWGGGSRRFIYAPSKLDAWGGHSWMANKFQTAMPGALLGTDHVIDFMLRHFWVLYTGVIVFSAAELIAGACLIAGLFTRAAALVSMGFSVALMLMFGWQGATCIDEWTMAAANLAMGTTLLLGGAGAYALDNAWLRRNPRLGERAWFRWVSGALPLPQTDGGFRNLALALFAFVIVFDVSTYSYYRGSVVTPFHGGPVSPTKHHLTLDHAALLPDGGVRFHVYLDGGTPEAPAHVMQAELVGPGKQVLAAVGHEDPDGAA